MRRDRPRQPGHAWQAHLGSQAEALRRHDRLDPPEVECVADSQLRPTAPSQAGAPDELVHHAAHLPQQPAAVPALLSPDGAQLGEEIQSASAPQPALALDADERLPWLESDDDDDGAEQGAVDAVRLLRFVAIGVALLALLVGAIWLANRSNTAPGDAIKDGAVIPAPTEPYKTEPADKGGKTYAGTGDSAFAVSEGKSTPAKLGGADTPVAPPATGSAAAAGGGAAGETGGVGVQVGAYTSLATAEAGWSRLSSSHDLLKGLKHRVLEGSADIGKVYRLQAVTADLASANALCSGLKASGVPCQVKH